MAITASGLYVKTFLDVFDATQAAIAPLADTIKIALFNNSLTPDFSADTAYGVAPYNANEVVGTNYVAGGNTLGSKTFSELTATQAAFDAADTSWATSTIPNARGALVWDDTVSDMALCLINFGADYSTVAGTFSITFDAAGIFYIDCY